MQTIALPEGDSDRWPFLASLLLHVLFAALVILVPVRVRQALRDERRVVVEIVTPDQLAAARIAERAPKAEPRPEAPVADPVPLAVRPADPSATRTAGNGGGGMVRATKMLSAAALSRPVNREAMAMLRALGGDERAGQLCNVEAMEQLHALREDVRPERVVAYATAEPVMIGDVLSADGAAVQSNGRWYGLSFRCELTEDRQAVAGFEFALGEPIPASKWETYRLPDAGPPGADTDPLSD